MNRKDRRAAKKNKHISLDPAEQQKALLIQQALDAAAELMQYEKLDDAETVYKGILEHAPSNTTATFNLGIIEHRKMHLDHAEKWFNQVLTINPNDYDALSALGLVKFDQGDIDKGLELSKKSIEMSPSPEACTRLGTLLREMGMIDEGLKYMYKSIELDPDFVGGWYDIANTKKFTLDDPDLAKMQKLDKKSDKLSNTEQIQLKFALSKCLMDAGDYKESFKSLNKANSLKRKSITYIPEFMETYMNEIASLFTPELFKKFKDVGNPTDKPIFIVGMPRSGTTLTEQILASHPDVYGAGELDYVKNSVPFILNKDMPLSVVQNEATCHKYLIEALTPEVIYKIGQDYLNKINIIAPDAKHVTDKMPFNFTWIGIIKLALPNAKIIHCNRNPADNALSIYRQSFTQLTPWAYNLEEIARTYNSYNKLMEHWNNLFPDQIYKANYDNIVLNQEAETRKLLKFCNLEWNDSCLEFYKTRRQVKTASVYQVRQPIYKSSVKGWRRFEEEMQPFINILDSKLQKNV